MDYNITRHTNFIMKFDIFLIKRWFKHQYQTLTRGFSDKETWDLSLSLAKHILPRLKRFKEVHGSYPIGMTQKSWNAAIDDMIYAIEATTRDSFDRTVDYKRVNRGLKLFGKHFRDLWW